MRDRDVQSYGILPVFLIMRLMSGHPERRFVLYRETAEPLYGIPPIVIEAERVQWGRFPSNWIPSDEYNRPLHLASYLR